MRILVTGGKGQLGADLCDELSKRGHTVFKADIDEMDITNPEQTSAVIREFATETVIHCAAYTNVEMAEEQIDICRKINALGTKNVAKVCQELDIPMIYISTDYVFNGQGEHYWKTDDERAPISAYGQTKYEGELAVTEYLEKYFIVRISWVFGIHGNNFVKTMLNLAKTRDQLTVVSDQIGSPTYTPDLAVLLADMIVTDHYGTYHATNEGLCSWYEFACEIFRQAGLSIQVKPVPSAEYITKAKRPGNSRMDKSRLDEAGFKRLPPWQDALKRFLSLYEGR